MVPKVAAIFFLSVMLVSQTPFQQLLKLPVLVEHFIEHKNDTPAISFLEFIQLHYFNGSPKDEDYEKDQQLPFQADAVVVFNSNVELPEHHFKIDVLPLYKEKSYPFISIVDLADRHGFDIWQPPKSC